MDDIEQLYMLITIIFLIFTYTIYHKKLLTRYTFIHVRLTYYAYWYWLLYIDIPKYILILLTFGYLLITSFETPNVKTDENKDTVDTYIKGYRRGYQRGCHNCH